MQLVWVNGVFALAVSPLKASASGGPAVELPMQGILVDSMTHDWTTHGIDNPLSKMHLWCSDPKATIIRPSTERLEERMGRFWVTDSPAHRLYTLKGGDTLTSEDALLGCTLSLQKGAWVPADLEDICRVTQTDLKRYHLAPAAAAMVIESKLMGRRYGVPSVYRPTMWDREQKNNALSRRLYKQICGLSRYAMVG